jgi:4,5-DOPA dioxygenase extradiol
MTGMDIISPLFISHGSPMTARQPRAAGAFMQRLGPAIDSAFGRPKAIVAISAHTLARETVLLAAPRHQAVYDFGGFPAALSELRYDAPGAPQLAGEVEALLGAAGVAVHRLDQGGLDHGIWTPLRFMWPAADVPVLPLGWMPNSSPRQLFEMGSALAPLAAQGVLIMATGSITHNLRRVAFSRGDADAPEIAESAAFRRWWLQRSAARDWPALFDYRRAAPHGADMHPSDEHLLPWFVAAGAGGSDAAPLRLHDSVVFGCLGMDDYAFGASAPRLAQALPDATLSTAHR